MLQIPDAHEEYTDIFSKDVEPSRGKTGSHDTSLDNAVVTITKSPWLNGDPFLSTELTASIPTPCKAETSCSHANTLLGPEIHHAGIIQSAERELKWSPYLL